MRQRPIDWPPLGTPFSSRPGVRRLCSRTLRHPHQLTPTRHISRLVGLAGCPIGPYGAPSPQTNKEAQTLYLDATARLLPRLRGAVGGAD